MVEGCLNKLHVGSWEKGTPTTKRKEKSPCRKMRLSTVKKEKHTSGYCIQITLLLNNIRLRIRN